MIRGVAARPGASVASVADPQYDLPAERLSSQRRSAAAWFSGTCGRPPGATHVHTVSQLSGGCGPHMFMWYHGAWSRGAGVVEADSSHESGPAIRDRIGTFSGAQATGPA